ncbi:thioredoxin family protein [Paracoccus contaminans]|uniref:Thiol reductase thioredoxin n=1 Tax=Paracoccus contaminans TaxID=1945662 RepID=A0A1W6CW18_9RHOB|nr:thioredoxin domain-containing protein [Paracoccus contaminans]ARJ69044.1 thiol reductase thioredoxin [Paracoccus contaminans]
MSGRKLTCLSCGQMNRAPGDKLAEGPRCGVCGAALMTGKPASLDGPMLQKAARNDDVPLLVDYWAPWCGPCRMMAPEFDKAAQQLAGQVRLAKIDTQANPDAALRWNIQGIPAFILFSGGHERGRLSGARSAGQLVDWVRRQGRAPA